MSKCEATLKRPVKAQTLTGPSFFRTICKIGTRGDIKQYVRLKTRRNYAGSITVEASIISNPRFIHFEVDPDFPDIEVGRTSWRVTCYLGSNDEYLFCVSIVSDDPNNSLQQIEVRVTSETASSPSYSPPMQITVSA